MCFDPRFWTLAICGFWAHLPVVLFNKMFCFTNWWLLQLTHFPKPEWLKGSVLACAAPAHNPMTPTAPPNAPIWTALVVHSGYWSPVRLRIRWVIISIHPAKEHHTPSDSIITDETCRTLYRSYRPVLWSTDVAYNGPTCRRLRALRWLGVSLHT